MKNRRNSSNTKGLIIASAVGAAAVAVSLIAAYNSITKNLIPTASSSYSRTFTAKESSDVPVQNSVTNVPLSTESSDKTESTESAEPVNKPVKSEVGNIMPVEGEIDVPFSNGELVKSVTLGVWKTHDGADILCDAGTDVKSMSDGIVKEIKDDPLWGVCVTVEQSNGLDVCYCGLAKELSVKAGQELKQGEIIGKTGDTNQCEILQKPHLHIEVRDGDNYVDPLSVVKN